jgi:hypothetical protein
VVQMVAGAAGKKFHLWQQRCLAVWLLRKCLLQTVLLDYHHADCVLSYCTAPTLASSSSPSLRYGVVDAHSCVPTAYDLFNFV